MKTRTQKIFVLLIIALVPVFQLHASYIPYEGFNTKGKVKSLECSYFKYSKLDSAIVKDFYAYGDLIDSGWEFKLHSFQLNFDTNQRITSFLERDDSKTTIRKTIIQYNKFGQNNIVHFFSQGSLIYTDSIFYKDTSSRFRSFTYRYESGIDLVHTWHNIFDEKGNPVLTKYYNKKGKHTGNYRQKFDDRGNVIKETYWSKRKGLVKKEKNTYNSKNWLIDHKSYIKLNFFRRRKNITDYSFNDSGYIDRATTHFKLFARARYPDQFNMKLKKDIQTCKYAYDYDSIGNWVEQRIFYNPNDISEIVKRTIEYYD